jgi:hypothetical protein
MRACAFTVHNDQELEVFVEKRRDGFEIWMVGPVEGNRMVLDHRLTHDDLETSLAYARAGDLIWRNATISELPVEKHQNAIEMEETIKQGTFIDFERLHQTVFGHFGAIALLALNGESQSAEKALLGRWTDGILTLSIEANNNLRWSCTDLLHPLNVGERVHGHAPDWWNFALWRLHLLNVKYKCGMHVGILRVDEHELHFENVQSNQMAHVFHRA